MFTGYNQSGEALQRNEELIEKYPFIKVDEAKWWNPVRKAYDIGFTWLDDLEPGWYKAFGIELCEDLKKSIAEDGCEDTFEFLQIKEKFASLRLYAAGYGDATKEVLAKYEELSKYICGHCGEPATKITMGWYYPVCDECYERDVKGGFEDIWEWYGYGSLKEIADEIKNIKENYKYEEYWNTVRKEVDGESNP